MAKIMSAKEKIKKGEEQLKRGLKAFEEENYEKAIQFFTASAYFDNSLAMYYAGKCYEEGLGVPIDKEKAKDYYFDSASEGNIDGIIKTAEYYESGKFVELDKKKAFELNQIVYKNLDESMYEEYPEVFFKIGVFYYYGDGVEKNDEKAKEFLEKALSYLEMYDESILEYSEEKESCKDILEEMENE